MKLIRPFVCTLYKTAMLTVFIFVFFGLFISVQAQRAMSNLSNTTAYSSQLSAAPLLFTENMGQLTDREGNQRPDLLFTARSGGAKIFLTATGIHYQFERVMLPTGFKKDERKIKDREKQQALQKKIDTETARFTVSLKGANPNPIIRREEKSSYTENYYLTHCAVTDVHAYERLVYENVYPGIDWVVYTKAQHLEHDFIVHAGANPAQIKLQITDAENLKIEADGSLTIATALGKIREKAPISFCEDEKVATAFRQVEDGSICFAVAGYDKTKALTIDPSVTWATYYGGSADDAGASCATDALGNVYLAGVTYSTSGIASGGFQNTYTGSGDYNPDAFLVKFSNSGARLWATYYGGSSIDQANECTVDTSGNVYVAGETRSTSGIASGGFQNTFGGNYRNAFLVKFSSSGARLWATYYGGIGDGGSGSSCATDAAGNVYLAGETASTSGVASGGFQNTLGGGYYDAFLVKFNSSGTRLWATYYGGSGFDRGISCTVDVLGNVYLAGATFSASSISSGGFQNTYSGGQYDDAFLVKFSSSGARLWGTYYGGGLGDVGNSCTTDALGNVYLAGITRSTSGMASGGFQNSYGGGISDAFLVKFSSTGARLWATYYGGSSQDGGYSCVVNNSGNVYLVGGTSSASDIAFGGFQNTYGGNMSTDAMIVKFSSNGIRLWASYYGGNDGDAGIFCTLDTSGNVYIAGSTYSTSGIASGGFQDTLGGVSDALLIKIRDTSVYTSIANGDWNNPVIWSGGMVPDVDAVVVINTAVTVTVNATCYSLTVNPSGSVTVVTGVTLTVLH